MNKEEKQKVVDDLAERFSQANSIYLSDFKGLNVEGIQELRRQLKKESFDFKVIKNTLIKLAAEKAGIGQMAKDLTGPTAVTLIGDDPITPAKILATFGKDSGLPRLKIGLVDGAVVTEDQIIAIGKLPGRQELLAKLVGSLNSPIQGLVSTLNDVLGKFVRVVNAIAEEKKKSE